MFAHCKRHFYKHIETVQKQDVWFTEFGGSPVQDSFAEKLGLISVDGVEVNFYSHDEMLSEVEEIYLRLQNYRSVDNSKKRNA